LQEKRMLCLSTLLVFFHGNCCRPERMVDLGRGLGYRILICCPIQGIACGTDLQVIVHPGEMVVQFPLVTVGRP
jgi:hypothetical protein